MRPPEPDKRLDCRGLFCPLPVLRTERALAAMARGELLEVVATDPAAVIDIAVFSQRSGHEIVFQTRDAGLYRFILRRE